MIERLFFRQVDTASLAVFRMMFGALMLFETVNYGVFLCLDCLYRDPDFLFKYHHFEWAGMLPGRGLEWVFVAMGLGATGVMLGCFYRVSAVVLVLAFGYLFLLDQALYLNHFYLALLFATILVFVPAHRLWSVDAWRRPALRAERVPNWGRFWLGAQLEIVLVYAGIVKLNVDWLQLEPMRLWMNWRAADAAPVIQLLVQDPGIAVASYGVILLHLVGAPLLLFRRTRLIVFCIYAFFHVTNSFVFSIGIFPWMTLGATLLLFDPDWPRQVAARWRAWRGDVHDGGGERGDARGRGQGAALGRDTASDAGAAVDSVAKQIPATAAPARARSRAWRGAIVVSISTWLVLQALVPLRHYIAPGNVAWNEDGHRFSWRMKLRSKIGRAVFVVQYPDGSRRRIDPSTHLTAKQVRKMACLPDLLWQFAQFVETTYRRTPEEDVGVYVLTECSLNTRKAIPLVDRSVDLTKIPRDAPTASWLLPNDESLPRRFF